jgi:hypothetical protein
MRSLAPYTRATLRGSRRGRGHNSTSVPTSRVVTTNTKRLRPRRPPSPQPADILSASQTADIPSTSRIADIPSTSRTADIPSTSQTADIPSTSRTADIPSTSRTADIPSTSQTADIPSASRANTLKEEKVNIIKDLL